MLNTILIDNEAHTPSKIVCIGRNYIEHIEELGNEVPSEMLLFVKPNSAISETLHANLGETLHYESEICFVVNGGALAAVGFGLDLTKRSLQAQLKKKGLPWERAKAFDGAAVFSRFVSFSGDVNALSVELTINGQRIQSGSVEQMMHKPASILEEVSTFMRLNDGDIIMTGTPKGVGTVKSGDNFQGRIILAGTCLTEANWVAQ